MPEKQEELEWEARAGRFAALSVFIAALAPIASGIALSAALPTRIKNDVDQVNALAHHSGAFAMAMVITAIGWLAFIFPFHYLLRAARARVPVPRWIDPLIVIGPILLILALVLQLTDIVGRAQDAVPVNKQEAHDLLRDVSPAVRGLAAAGALSVGAVFVMVSTYAGRAGLLSRFMTIVGSIIGALTVFGTIVGAGSLAGPLVLFWGIALGMLFLNRWPGGRGPAWETCEAVPWPSGAQRQEAARAAADEEADEDDEPVAPDEPVTADEAAQQPNPRTARKRRKKKARR